MKTLIFTIFLALSLLGQARQQTNPSPIKLKSSLKKSHLITKDNKKISIRWAVTEKEKLQGLSGVRSKDFSKNESMLFLYPTVDSRQFWMPNTFFDLDIFFLDTNFKVLAIERNVTHHPGNKNPDKIRRTKRYLSQHVLEMRADSPHAKKIKLNDVLNIKTAVPISEIKSKIRLWQ